MTDQRSWTLGGAFRPPALPDGAVERPPLTARIDAAARGALTLVVAPAGWGKTTALAQWAHARGDAVAWIAVASGATAATAVDLLVGAIGSLGADVGDSPSAAGNALGEPLRAFLVERL